MEIPGNKPSRLDEILNSAASSIYFTERSAVYFNSISIVFLLGSWYLVLRTLFYFRIKFNIPLLISPVSITSITQKYDPTGISFPL